MQNLRKSHLSVSEYDEIRQRQIEIEIEIEIRSLQIFKVLNDVYTLWRVGAPSLLHPLVVNLNWMGDSARLNHSRVDKRKGQNVASWTPCPKCAGHVPGRGSWEFPSCLIAGLQHCIYARLVKCSATNNCKAESGGGGMRKMRGRVPCVCKSTGRPKCPLCQLFQAIDRA